MFHFGSQKEEVRIYTVTLQVKGWSPGIEGKRFLCTWISTEEARKLKHSVLFLSRKEMFTCFPPENWDSM